MPGCTPEEASAPGSWHMIMCIPLWTHPEQIPKDIDIACVVVRSTVAGGEGSQIAAALLARGIHVLQEHPPHPDDIARLQDLARQHDVLYWVNSFYPHLPAGRCWIEKAQRVSTLLHGERPAVAHLATSRQLLYSTLDMLMQACGVTDAGRLTVTTQANAADSFTTVGLHLPDAGQATLRLQNWLDPADPDMFSLVMHQATLFWPSGYLTLAASHGPVVWTGAFHDGQHHNRERTLYRYASEVPCYAQPTSVVLHQAGGSWREAFEVDAAAALGRLLQAMGDVLAGGAVPGAFSPPYQLSLGRLWLAVLQAIPAVTERSLTAPVPIDCDALAGTTATPGEPHV